MPVRFAFLTDTHHYPDAPENFGAPKMLTRSQEVLDAIPPALNTQAFDFVVHGGDFLCARSTKPQQPLIRSKRLSTQSPATTTATRKTGPTRIMPPVSPTPTH
jgi:predicted MPP superfamily phosphohydrolase